MLSDNSNNSILGTSVMNFEVIEQSEDHLQEEEQNENKRIACAGDHIQGDWEEKGKMVEDMMTQFERQFDQYGLVFVDVCLLFGDFDDQIVHCCLLIT